MKSCDTREQAFTLIELIAVVFILSLLLTLTLPGYQAQLSKTRRSLGGAQLLEVMLRQEQFFVDYKRYADNLVELDLPDSPYAIDAQGNPIAAADNDRIYLIDIATRANAYTLYAIPQLDQSRDHLCGTLGLDSMGIKSATGTAAAQDCW